MPKKNGDENMEKRVHLVLSAMDLGQIVEGLEQRKIIWQETANYLRFGFTDLPVIIEECSKASEAQAVADHYKHIIQMIKDQCLAQAIEKNGATG